MQTLSYVKLAATLVLGASAVLPAAAQAIGSGPTSTVVYAAADDLVVKAADGKLINYTVAPGTKFTAAGKPATLAELKPGTKLTAPVVGDAKLVASIEVIKGKVYGTTPPDGVTLSLAAGVKDFVVPAGTVFLVDGKKLMYSDLKPGILVEATVVTTAADGATVASAPVPPPMTGALLVAHPAGADDLPAAGTHLPLYGALGASFLMLGFALLGAAKPARRW